MKKTKLTALLLAGITALCLTACGGGADTTTTTAADTQAAVVTETTEAAAEATTEATTEAATEATEAAPSGAVIIDREGNELTLPESMERLVSAAPSNTEILTALGVGDKIIAADMYSFDAGVDAAICTIDMMNINLEEIIALEPDAVFLNGISMTGADDPYAALKEAGIAVIYIPSANSIDDIKADIAFIGQCVGAEDKAAEVVSDMETRIAAVEEKLSGAEPKSVYFEISAAPWCYTTGSGTFSDEMLTIAGGKNVFSDLTGWASISEEQVIEKNPDVIISTVAYEGYSYEEILAREGWSAVNAVANGDVYLADANSTSRASQNIAAGIEELAKILHPELF